MYIDSTNYQQLLSSVTDADQNHPLRELLSVDTMEYATKFVEYQNKLEAVNIGMFRGNNNVRAI